MYQRVIPRDLFNESKLLKCLGQLALLIHNGRVPPTLTMENDGNPFEIDQRQDDGGLHVVQGLTFLKRENRLELYSTYNCKDPFPLLCEIEDYDTLEVFDDNGQLTEEFRNYLSA